MDADEVLSQFTIPTPCSMDWNRMRGDDELCGRLDLRPDGKLFASDDSPAHPGVATAAQYTIRSLMMVIAACATIMGMTKMFLGSPEKPNPNPPTTRFPLQLMGKMVPRRSVTTPASGAPSCTTPVPPAGRMDG